MRQVSSSLRSYSVEQRDIRKLFMVRYLRNRSFLNERTLNPVVIYSFIGTRLLFPASLPHAFFSASSSRSACW